jgi:hypothetical protein
LTIIYFTVGAGHLRSPGILVPRAGHECRRDFRVTVNDVTVLSSCTAICPTASHTYPTSFMIHSIRTWRMSFTIRLALRCKSQALDRASTSMPCRALIINHTAAGRTRATDFPDRPIVTLHEKVSFQNNFIQRARCTYDVPTRLCLSI